MLCTASQSWVDAYSHCIAGAQKRNEGDFSHAKWRPVVQVARWKKKKKKNGNGRSNLFVGSNGIFWKLVTGHLWSYLGVKRL